AIELKGNAVIGEEILSEKEKLNEYVMLALRSKGLDLLELNNFFGNEWLMKNKNYLKQLGQEKFLIEKGKTIKFTPKGYTLCDEILSRFK
ncbi:MAG: coproporphyrinogen III oxidase family protein, partial [Ignavibacteriales bacterium]